MATYNLTVTVYNDSDIDLALAGATIQMGSWGERPTNPLSAHSQQTCTCGSYNMNGANMQLQYNAPDGTQMVLWACIPPMTRNVCNAQIFNGSGWQVNCSIGYGDSPTAVFHLSTVSAKPPMELEGVVDAPS